MSQVHDKVIALMVLGRSWGWCVGSAQSAQASGGTKQESVPGVSQFFHFGVPQVI